jgi:homogentisate 1,2-dioxygenase
MTQVGMAAHAYVFNDDMIDDYFFNADGELLIVPQLGTIRVFTEMGIMDVEPSEICLIPRGMMFKVSRLGEAPVMARLYLRKLRRQIHPAGSRPDRCQLPGQSARLQDAGGSL